MCSVISFLVYASLNNNDPIPRGIYMLLDLLGLWNFAWNYAKTA